MPWDEIGPTPNQEPAGDEPWTITGGGYLRGHKIAHWGDRVLATLIDVVLAIFVAGIIGSIIGAYWLVLFATWGYFDAYGLDGRGTSPGKKIRDLTVIVARVDPMTRVSTPCYPTQATLFWRYVGHIVDMMILYLGFLRPLVDPNRQTLADTMAGCHVMKSWPHDKLPLVADTGGIRDRV